MKKGRKKIRKRKDSKQKVVSFYLSINFAWLIAFRVIYKWSKIFIRSNKFSGGAKKPDNRKFSILPRHKCKSHFIENVKQVLTSIRSWMPIAQEPLTYLNLFIIRIWKIVLPNVLKFYRIFLALRAIYRSYQSRV